MKLSHLEHLMVLSMRGAGRTKKEVLENLSEPEREELIGSLKGFLRSAKLILYEWGVTDSEIYQSDEDYFEKIFEFRAMLHGDSA